MTAFIAPDGRFFSFIAHEAFSERLLKPALGTDDAKAATRGWLRISHQNMGFRRPDPKQPPSQKTGIITHCWHHVSDRDVSAYLTRAQIRMLEKTGYSAADKEQKTTLSYQHVFKDDDTPGMKSLREQVARALSGKYRDVAPAEARAMAQGFGRRRGTKPPDPAPGS
jgi:hypothetical protein